MYCVTGLLVELEDKGDEVHEEKGGCSVKKGKKIHD